MDRISCSFIFNDESRFSILMVRGQKVLVFDYSVHYDAKNFLKRSAFFEEFEIISPFTNREGIESIFLLFTKRFNIFQYVSGAVSGLLSFLLNSLIYFSVVAKIISVHSFDLVSAFSKSVFFHHPYNIVLLNSSVLLIYSYNFCHPRWVPIIKFYFVIWDKIMKNV